MSMFLDVVFAGIILSALSEPEIVDDFELNETTLASGNTFVQASTVPKFTKTYICGPADIAEMEALRAKRGLPGDLVIDGLTYSNCYIKPPLTFSRIMNGAWQYKITFIQHTGTAGVVNPSFTLVVDGGSA